MKMEFGKRMIELWRVWCLNIILTCSKSSCLSDFAELLEAMFPKVSTDMNERLTGDFQGIEVHKALRSEEHTSELQSQ